MFCMLIMLAFVYASLLLLLIDCDSVFGGKQAFVFDVFAAAAAAAVVLAALVLYCAVHVLRIQ